MEKNNPLFVSFSTQKGGAGKSAFTTLVASILHYQKGYNVLVIDCDEGQYSLHRMRQRDLEIIQSDATLREKFEVQYEKIEKNAYSILCAPPSEAVDVALYHIDNIEEKIDLVLFDLPGTVHNKGVLDCVTQLDYIFTPITCDKMVLESSLAFAMAVRDYLISDDEIRLKSLHLFWNMVDGRERTNLYEVYTNIIDDLQLPILGTRIPDKKRYRKEMTKGIKDVFRSTLFPCSSQLIKDSKLPELITEVLNIIKL